MNDIHVISRDQAIIQEYVKDLELKGYCVIENALSANSIDLLREEVKYLEERYLNVSASKNRLVLNETRFMLHELQFENCPEIHNLIYSSKAVDIILEATGDELVCTGSTYAHCKPGYPGIPLHTDCDPYGANTYRPSNPVSVRVVYYLDDLSAKKSPLRVVPYSHLSLHKNKRPDLESFEPMQGELTITCAPGTAVIMNTKLFHGVYANNSDSGRRVLAISYRPRWSPPINPVVEYEQNQIDSIPLKLKPFFTDLNK